MGQKDDKALIVEFKQLDQQWLADCPKDDCNGYVPIHQALPMCDVCRQMYQRDGLYTALIPAN